MITNVILQILNRCIGNPLSESVLLSSVRCTGTKCGESAFADAMTKLKQGGWASCAEEPLTGDNFWSITKKGIAHITGGK